MRLVIALFLIVYLGVNQAHAQKYLSYGMMTESIRQTVHENEIQEEARNNQLAIDVIETENKKEVGKIREIYEEVLQRLNKLGLLIDAAFLIQEVTPEVNYIATSQARLFNKIKQYPQYVYLVAEQEYYLINQARSLLNYMTGLTLTAVDIAGMKQGDRMLLLQHVYNEIRTLSAWSWRMESIVNNKIWEDRLKQYQMKTWINREKEIMGQILKNANEIFN